MYFVFCYESLSSTYKPGQANDKEWGDWFPYTSLVLPPMLCVLTSVCFPDPICFILVYFFQAANPRLSTTSQLPGQLSHDQTDAVPAIPPPVPVVGKLTVKGKFDFTSVSDIYRDSRN